jgi:hypothetical protein
MTVAALAEAIQFLMREETSAAAKAVARRMENEQGIQAAVESFHRPLPIKTMQCDLIPDQPAEVLISQWTKLRKELKS